MEGICSVGLCFTISFNGHLIGSFSGRRSIESGVEVLNLLFGSVGFVYVMVLGYLPLPAWSLSDSCQAQQGLDTNVMTFHNWLSVLQMVAPGAAI